MNNFSKICSTIGIEKLTSQPKVAKQMVGQSNSVNEINEIFGNKSNDTDDDHIKLKNIRNHFKSTVNKPMLTAMQINKKNFTNDQINDTTPPVDILNDNNEININSSTTVVNSIRNNSLSCENIIDKALNNCVKCILLKNVGTSFR